MTKREIYLEAARRIAEGHSRFACLAIDKVSGTPCCTEAEEFQEAFRPDLSESRRYQMDGAFGLGSYVATAKENRHVRVIALCLAAEAL